MGYLGVVTKSEGSLEFGDQIQRLRGLFQNFSLGAKHVEADVAN